MQMSEAEPCPAGGDMWQHEILLIDQLPEMIEFYELHLIYMFVYQVYIKVK